MTYDNFEDWWSKVGSGIVPLPDHDMEAHAERIAKLAWESAKGLETDLFSGSYLKPRAQMFTEWWLAMIAEMPKGYARDKENARRRFYDALGQGVTFEVMIGGLPKYRMQEAERRRVNGGRNFQKMHPSRWLAGRRWEDDIEPVEEEKHHGW